MLQAPEGMYILFRGSGSHLSFSKDACGLSVSSPRTLLHDRCPPQNASLKKVAQDF